MKKLPLLISFLLFGCMVNAQVLIPKFRSNTTDNPFASIKGYDLLLACRSYDNVAHTLSFSVLVYKNKHWQKLAYKEDAKEVPLTVTQPQLKQLPITDAQGDSLYHQLSDARIFTIGDDSSLPKCDKSLDVINGTKEMVDHTVEDGPEFRIWLATPTKTKYLYYYAPESFQQFCPGNKARQNVVKIIKMFNTGW
ncbi:MAG: hypothetical protein V4560_05675 [Bacteroidota bacterium]